MTGILAFPALLWAAWWEGFLRPARKEDKDEACEVIEFRHAAGGRG